MLVVFDCDSTLIEEEVIELIAEAAGTRELVAQVTEKAMRGELDFAESLTERVATLDGVADSIFQKVLAQITPSRGVKELITHIHELGGVVAVVSGGFHEVLDGLAEKLHIDRWRANRLEVQTGALTGKTLGPIIDGAAKASFLQELTTEYGIASTHTVAIGDGANDLPMMEIAGLSVAYNAKPAVRDAADLIIDDDLSLVIPHLPVHR